MQQNIIYIKSLLTSSFTDHTFVKGVGSVLFTIGSFLFSGLSDNALMALLTLIVVDYVLAVYESRKRGQVWSGPKTKNSVIKILVYYTMIACGHLVEYGIPSQIQFLDDTILTFLLITEFLSILKHFSNLGYKTPSKLINNLREEIGEKDVVSTV